MRKVLKGLLFRRRAWRFFRPFILLYAKRERNRPFTIWVDFLIWVLGEAFSGSRPVVWANSFFPVELIYSLDAIPFLPEIFSALVAYFDLSRAPLLEANMKVSTDICSFYRCFLGLMKYGIFPPPHLVVSSPQICDGARAFYREVSRELGVPYLLLDVPYGVDERKKLYLSEELKSLYHEMGKALGVEVREEKLARLLKASNEIARILMNVAELRKAVPSPFPGSEGLSYVAGMLFWASGTEMGVRFFRELKSYVEARVRKRRGYLKNERFRIIWLHHIRPYYTNPLFSFLESRGVSVCYEEVNYPWWKGGDPSDPFVYLADRLLADPWWGPLDRRVEIVRKMVEYYRPHGVVHFSHWGCRQSTGGAQVIGSMVKEIGVPYLILPGDGADPDNYSQGQSITRLQAFVELMEGVWGSM